MSSTLNTLSYQTSTSNLQATSSCTIEKVDSKSTKAEDVGNITSAMKTNRIPSVPFSEDLFALIEAERSAHWYFVFCTCFKNRVFCGPNMKEIFDTILKSVVSLVDSDEDQLREGLARRAIYRPRVDFTPPLDELDDIPMNILKSLKNGFDDISGVHRPRPEIKLNANGEDEEEQESEQDAAIAMAAASSIVHGLKSYCSYLQDKGNLFFDNSEHVCTRMLRQMEYVLHRVYVLGSMSPKGFFIYRGFDTSKNERCTVNTTKGLFARSNFAASIMFEKASVGDEHASEPLHRSLTPSLPIELSRMILDYDREYHYLIIYHRRYRSGSDLHYVIHRANESHLQEIARKYWNLLRLYFNEHLPAVPSEIAAFFGGASIHSFIYATIPIALFLRIILRIAEWFNQLLLSGTLRADKFPIWCAVISYSARAFPELCKKDNSLSDSTDDAFSWARPHPNLCTNLQKE